MGVTFYCCTYVTVVDRESYMSTVLPDVIDESDVLLLALCALTSFLWFHVDLSCSSCLPSFWSIKTYLKIESVENTN